MKQEIRQNRVAILTSEDNCSVPAIFNNLTGKNHDTNKEYQTYVETIAISLMGFTYGKIERVENGEVVETGQISKNISQLNTGGLPVTFSMSRYFSGRKSNKKP